MLCGEEGDMLCYDVLACRNDHHRCYNPHHEDLTVSPVAGRGNVGWRPCGELDLTEFIVSIIFVIPVVDTNAIGYCPSQDQV